MSPKACYRTMGNKTQISVSNGADGKDMVAGRDKTDPIIRMIERYSINGLDGWEAEVSCLNSIKSCVYGCNEEEVNGVIKQPRHLHQVCIATSALESCTKALMNSDILSKIEHLDSFEELYEEVKGICAVKGTDQICYYDTSLRVLHSLKKGDGKLIEKLRPKEYVFLHRGSLWGAQSLWKINALRRMYHARGFKPLTCSNPSLSDFPRWECRKPIGLFCKQLQTLGASGIEDFLCVHHNELKGYYLNMAKKLAERK